RGRAVIVPKRCLFRLGTVPVIQLTVNRAVATGVGAPTPAVAAGALFARSGTESPSRRPRRREGAESRPKRKQEPCRTRRYEATTPSRFTSTPSRRWGRTRQRRRVGGQGGEHDQTIGRPRGRPSEPRESSLRARGLLVRRVP